MEMALSAGDWIAGVEFPDLSAFESADAWVDAFFGGQSARGPRHAAEPAVDYGFLWALWLSAVPYGLWSERISGPSLAEHAQWLGRLEHELERAIEHFELKLRDDATLSDLACAIAALIEGAWLNQCLTAHHPVEGSEPIAALLVAPDDCSGAGRSSHRPAEGPRACELAGQHEQPEDDDHGAGCEGVEDGRGEPADRAHRLVETRGEQHHGDLACASLWRRAIHASHATRALARPRRSGSGVSWGTGLAHPATDSSYG